MPSSRIHVRVAGRSYVVDLERTGGHLDHYYHFILDLAWPLHAWAERAHGGWDQVQDVRSEDPKALYFAAHFQRMLDRGLRAPDLWTRVREGFTGRSEVTLKGFNSRVRDYADVFDGLEAFRASRRAFVGRVAANLQVPQGMGSQWKVVLIERTGGDDRGAVRRSIGDHAALNERLDHQCRAAGATFVNVQLEEMDAREQLALVREGPTVLVGQHGAGLLNGLWMEHRASAVIELAGEDNPTHFTNLYQDLGVRYERLIAPAEGVYGRQQVLRPEPMDVWEAIVRAMRG